MLKVLPYTALRTLEAVVRLRGFGRAAEELNVTQSAVSQHIKSLEEWLGHRLLHRSGRLTEPTQAGAQLAEGVRNGFGAVEALCDDLRTSTQRRPHSLRVAAPPGFAFLWLLPRLLEFDQRPGSVPVSLSTDPASLDPRSSDADVLICYSLGGFPEMHADLLLGEDLFPVAAPDVAATLQSPADLARHIVLEDSFDDRARASNWDIWSQSTGVRLPAFDRTRRFGQANLVIQAAIGGLGVAMGRSPLVQDALDDGKLVRPFKKTAPSQYAYWFVCRHQALETPAVRSFHEWLLQTDAVKPTR